MISKSYDSFRRARQATEQTPSEAARAFKNVGSLSYGEPIREFLASIVVGTEIVETEGAWQEREGRRKLAQQILDMMDPANARTGSATRPSQQDRSD